MAMTRRPFLAATATAIFAIAFFNCSSVFAAAAADTEQRNVGAFSRVAIGGPFEVVLRPAAKESVEVRAAAEVLPLVETRVEGSGSERGLRIELRRGTQLPAGTPIVVTVGFVQLESVGLGGNGRLSGSGLRAPRLAVSLGGNGSVRLAALDVERLDVSLGGSGRFEAEGRAGRLELSIGGSGNVDASRLQVRDARVSIAGSGDARIRADSTLEATIAGSGSVVYDGAAQPRVTVIGSGSVKKAS